LGLKANTLRRRKEERRGSGTCTEGLEKSWRSYPYSTSLG